MQRALAITRVGRRHNAGRAWRKSLQLIDDKDCGNRALRVKLRKRGILRAAARRRRRLVVRYDSSLSICRSFIHLARLMIVLPRVAQ
jgi:hypothetical protein